MTACKGYNCKSTDGRNHSTECELEYNSSCHYGAGDKHPNLHSAGYTFKKLPKDSTDEQRAAWWEGFISRGDA